MSADKRACACKAQDAYDCWAERYPPAGPADDPLDEFGRIEFEGGPCECECHDSAADREFQDAFA